MNLIIELKKKVDDEPVEGAMQRARLIANLLNWRIDQYGTGSNGEKYRAPLRSLILKPSQCDRGEGLRERWISSMAGRLNAFDVEYGKALEDLADYFRAVKSGKDEEYNGWLPDQEPPDKHLLPERVRRYDSFHLMLDGRGLPVGGTTIIENPEHKRILVGVPGFLRSAQPFEEYDDFVADAHFLLPTERPTGYEWFKTSDYDEGFTTDLALRSGERLSGSSEPCFKLHEKGELRRKIENNTISAGNPSRKNRPDFYAVWERIEPVRDDEPDRRPSIESGSEDDDILFSATFGDEAREAEVGKSNEMFERLASGREAPPERLELDHYPSP